MKKTSDSRGVKPKPATKEKSAGIEVTIGDRQDNMASERAVGMAADDVSETGNRKRDMANRRTTKRTAASIERNGKELPPAAPTACLNQEVPRDDDRVVLQVRIRPTLRWEIKRLADEAGVTVQTFTLLALKELGVGVTDADMLDLRKGEHRAKRHGPRGVGNDATPVDSLQRALDVIAAGILSARGGGAAPISGVAGGGINLTINYYAESRPDP